MVARPATYVRGPTKLVRRAASAADAPGFSIYQLDRLASLDSRAELAEQLALLHPSWHLAQVAGALVRQALQDV
jgi:hypothetical protein